MVVDYQYDFVDTNGALPVPGADKIWQTIQNKINDDKYTDIVYTFDTHTINQYNGSDEQKIFPNIHCEFGTKGWNFYKIIPRTNKVFKNYINGAENVFNKMTLMDKNVKEHFFTKNVFDIWEGNKDYPNWFETTFDKKETIVDVVGVATNYCVFMNVMGLIERGYKVNIIENAVEGIKAFPDGTIDQTFENNINKMKEYGVTFEKGN